MWYQPYIPRIKHTWSWCIVNIIHCWVLSAKFCIGFLCLCLWGIVVCGFLFLCYLWFGYQGNTSLIKWDWKYSSSSLFWKTLYKIGGSSLMFGRILQWNPLDLDIFQELLNYEFEFFNSNWTIQMIYFISIEFW